MKNSKGIVKLTVLSMLIALGVIISPLLRFEGMCPMAHFINIVCSVLMGPWYSLLCAVIIGIIRMMLMSIPPIALTGAIFGAFLSGVFYKLSKGKIVCAVIGEIIGTGIVGAICSYPVMTFFWGKEGLSWLFYVPSFICGTLIGGSIAFVFLKRLSRSGLLAQFQATLGSRCYSDTASTAENAAALAAFGVICYTVIKILTGIFGIASPFFTFMAYFTGGVFISASVVYYTMKRSVHNDIKPNQNKN